MKTTFTSVCFFPTLLLASIPFRYASATPLSSSITHVINVSCFGGNNGSAIDSASGGTSPYTYSWMPSGGTNAKGTGLTAGTYTCIVTDASSNTTSVTVNITQPPPLTLSTTIIPANCGGFNGAAIAIVSGGSPGYTYSWTDGWTGATSTGLSAGNYTVYIVDANGCTDSAPATITTLSPPLITIYPVSSSSCYGGCAAAVVTGGSPPYSYLWTPSGSTTDTACYLTSGIYTVTVIDSLGCTGSAVATITSPPALTAYSVGNPVTSCLTANGMAATTQTGGSPPYTYSWTPTNQTTDVATGLSAGSYTCVVTDNNGCTATTITTIGPDTLAPTLTILTTPDTGGCTGTAIASISGGFPPYTYSWSNGATTFTISGLCGNANYCCVIHDSLGCHDSSCGTVISQCPVFNPLICYVTTDTNSVHNIVIWQKSGVDTLAVDSFVVYRGVTSTIYNQIGEVSVHGFTQYVDTTSSPNVSSYYYKLGFVDTCLSTNLSPYHKSILLQSSLGIGNKINLSWNAYLGDSVNYYRILRDDSGLGNWHVLDSVPGGVFAFTDTAAPLNPNLRYRLSLNWDVVCAPYLVIKPRHHTLSESSIDEGYSNISDAHITGIPQLSVVSGQWSVYPNPSDGIFTVALGQAELVSASQTNIAVYNVLGELVETQCIASLQTNTSSKFNLDLSSQPNGVYILSIETPEGKEVIKCIKL